MIYVAIGDEFQGIWPWVVTKIEQGSSLNWDRIHFENRDRSSSSFRKDIEADLKHGRLRYSKIEIKQGDRFEMLQNTDDLPSDSPGDIWVVSHIDRITESNRKVGFTDYTSLTSNLIIEFLNRGIIKRIFPDTKIAQSQSQTPSTKCLHPNKAQYISLISIDKNFTYCKDCGEKL